MTLRKLTLAAFGVAALIAAAPAAFACDRDAPCPCPEVHLSDAFFADEGGVGPAYDSYSGGGGGGGYIEESASANAEASASAFASASARVSFNGGFHGHGARPCRPCPPPPCRGGGRRR